MGGENSSHWQTIPIGEILRAKGHFWLVSNLLLDERIDIWRERLLLDASLR
jgi:hypothetical protein